MRQQLQSLAEKNRSEKDRMDELLEGVIHSQKGELEMRKAEFVDLQVDTSVGGAELGLLYYDLRRQVARSAGGVALIVERWSEGYPGNFCLPPRAIFTAPCRPFPLKSKNEPPNTFTALKHRHNIFSVVPLSVTQGYYCPLVGILRYTLGYWRCG